MRYMKDDMKGHIRMWSELAKKHGSMTSQHPVTKEVWEYMGSTETHHQFRHRDLMIGGVEQGRVYENIPIQADDFDHLTRYEYTTRLMPFTHESANSLPLTGKYPSDAEMEKQGWVRAWAEHVDNGSFIVYRRLRAGVQVAPDGSVL